MVSLGLYQAGWHGVFAIEKNPCAFETLKYNLDDGKKHFAWPKWLPKEPLDILEVITKYENELKGLQGTIDLVAGGPPCQGFYADAVEAACKALNAQVRDIVR